MAAWRRAIELSPGEANSVANFGAARDKLIRRARTTHRQACLYLKPLKFLK